MPAVLKSNVARSTVSVRFYLGSMLIAGVAVVVAVYGMLLAIAADVGESMGAVGLVMAEILVEVLTAVLAVAWLVDVWRQLLEWFGGP